MPAGAEHSAGGDDAGGERDRRAAGRDDEDGQPREARVDGRGDRAEGHVVATSVPIVTAQPRTVPVAATGGPSRRTRAMIWRRVALISRRVRSSLVRSPTAMSWVLAMAMAVQRSATLSEQREPAQPVELLVQGGQLGLGVGERGDGGADRRPVACAPRGPASWREPRLIQIPEVLIRRGSDVVAVGGADWTVAGVRPPRRDVRDRHRAAPTIDPLCHHDGRPHHRASRCWG